MLFSKANLTVAKVASGNPYDGPLNGVALESDGSTVAGNGRVFLAVGPAQKDLYFPEVGELADIGQGIVVNPELATEAAKIIPKDKQISLQHVALTEPREPGKVEFTSADRSGRERRVAERPKRERYPDWRRVVREARGQKPLRICVGRKDLISMLQALDEAAPDDGDSALYLEMGNGLVMRAVCKTTGQRVIGVAGARKMDDAQWLADDDWEKTVMVERGGIRRRFVQKRD